MSEELRHSVHELAARYSLEPTIQDVYVEGMFDREVLESHFKSYQSPIVFYEIDTVDIKPETLKKHNLTDGSKQRVIALARELASLKGDPAVRYLVDRDLDHWYGPLESTSRLVWTKYCSLELYFFRHELIADLMLTAKSKISAIEPFCDSLKLVLAELYIMRLADGELKWSMSWLAPSKLLTFKNGILLFDQSKYIERLLQSNGKAKLANIFKDKCDTWRSTLSGDARMYIRGHDFVDTLAWCVGKSGGLKAFSATETLERLLILLADRAHELSEITK